MHISYNKAQELANHIEGAEVREYDSGNIAIVLNAKVPRINGVEDKDAPLEPLTKYNKATVSYEEAKELIREKHPFVLNGNKFRGYWIETTYFIYSYDIPIYKCVDPIGLWDNISKESIEISGKIPAGQRKTMERHIETVEEALRND